MINITTRIPASVKAKKFKGALCALHTLQELIHEVLHTDHTEILLSPSPIYWIQLHGFNIENDRCTINITLLKNQQPLQEGVEIQYKAINKSPQFFSEGTAPVTDWKPLIQNLLSSIH